MTMICIVYGFAIGSCINIYDLNTYKFPEKRPEGLKMSLLSHFFVRALHGACINLRYIPQSSTYFARIRASCFDTPSIMRALSPLMFTHVFRDDCK